MTLSSHPAFIELPFSGPRNAPPDHDNSDQYPETLVRYFLERFTKKDQKVFDPFLGFGTTAFVAENMGRIPYGIEADGERFEWAAGQLEHWDHIRHGDSAAMLDYGFPKMDFVITSPPYMPCHHKWNPLYGGDPTYAGYDCYLERMAFIFQKLASLMKKNAYLVVQADNLPGRRYTPLVRDLGFCIAKTFRPDAEIIVKWSDTQPNNSHTHCLIFKNI